MFGKLSIRNIPEEILAALSALATRNERSVEAEGRFALRSHVQPVIQDEIRNTRLVEVGKRLTSLLDQVNQVRAVRTIRPSHVAQAIGEERGSDVEDWFIGKQEPTFTQLAAIAEHLGGSQAWLQHGDGRMFDVDTRRLSENAGEAVTQLLNLDREHRPVLLHLVREEDETGRLFVIQQFNDWRCSTWSTPIHVSDRIGAGGEKALACLTVTLNLLYKYQASGRGLHVIVKSYQLPSEACNAILGGNTHPLLPLEGGTYERPWWEDLWDAEQFRKGHEYWPGYRSMCERIYRVVSSEKYLNEAREQITRREHPLLCGEPGVWAGAAT
ncbi:FitA-like ribbon-helix-helix domain-containing protein [Burkholderia sp. PR2]|uniref:FitA-like ribbon-helix-helix domain-containing protein n=1 Tax=Burkholderia sp. PR2 TaxID=3448078 RepID=UPI00402AA593